MPSPCAMSFPSSCRRLSGEMCVRTEGWGSLAERRVEVAAAAPPKRLVRENPESVVSRSADCGLVSAAGGAKPTADDTRTVRRSPRSILGRGEDWKRLQGAKSDTRKILQNKSDGLNSNQGWAPADVCPHSVRLSVPPGARLRTATDRVRRISRRRAASSLPPSREDFLVPSLQSGHEPLSSIPLLIALDRSSLIERLCRRWTRLSVFGCSYNSLCSFSLSP